VLANRPVSVACNSWSSNLRTSVSPFATSKQPSPFHPKAIESKPTSPNEIGMHRVPFSVDDIDKALEIAARHGCRPLRGVATYEDVYKLTYVRGPSGIIVMLAEELKKN
jgi:catechol 2,3-dioxygenase-like lactoylglutathione lyase family enzyme